jgi:DNA-binding MurR/RpiR family transcriptional regulator
MTRHVEVRQRIRAVFETLPENQRAIGEFFLENLDRISFLSVQEVARSTHSSVASIVRFARRVGFTGYSQLREKIGEDIQHHLKRPTVFTLPEESNGDADTFTLVARQDVRNIDATLARVDRKVFESAVQGILRAERVWTMGLGLSQLLSQLLAYQLNQVGINAASFRHGSSTFAEQAFFASPRDVVVAFSFKPYSQETVDTAQWLRKHRVPLIAVTNSTTAPITASARWVLEVKSENMLFTNSFAAISVLINAISTECAVRDKSRAQRMVRDLNSPTATHDLLL